MVHISFSSELFPGEMPNWSVPKWVAFRRLESPRQSFWSNISHKGRIFKLKGRLWLLEAKVSGFMKPNNLECLAS